MKVSLFGLGYVGGVTARGLANDGHEIIGMDVRSVKVGKRRGGLPPRSGVSVAGLIAGLLCLGTLPAWSVTFRWASSSNRIYVTGPGSATLSDIKAALPTAPLVQTSPGVWQLRANLQIENGGALVLHGTAIGGDVDEFRLQSNNSSVSNNYVWVTADWGSLDIRRTKITSWDDAVGGPDTEYTTYQRAYVRVRSSLAADGVTALESRMDIVDSDIGYLGFDGAESYGLSWKVNGTQPNLYNLVNVYGDIQNSHIHDNWFGVFTYGAYGMQIQNNEFDHNVKYGLDPHDDSDALLIEGNHSHHNGDHGIIASMRCDHLIIRNNLSEYNDGNGIMLHRSSDDGLIANNTCQYNTDSGIAIFDSRRTLITNNLCRNNDGAGLRFSVGGSDNLAENNELSGNGKYGIYLYQGSDIPRAGDDGRDKGNQFISNSIHDNASEGVKLGDGDYNEFVNNIFAANGSVLRFSRGVGNVLDGNVISNDVVVKTEGNATFVAQTLIRNQPWLQVQIDTRSSVLFEDALGAVFDPVQPGIATTVSPNGSSLLLTSPLIGASSTVVTLDFLAAPNSGNALVTPTIWNTSGDLSKQWTTQASSQIQQISYSVGDLAANQSYRIRKNGHPLGKKRDSDASGHLSFSDAPGTTSLVQYDLDPVGK